MSSATSLVRETLDAYLGGRITAERLVAVVAEAYYRDEGRGTRDGLRPVLQVIERAAPGAVELTRSEGPVGFEIRPGERAFPKQYEVDLRAAAEAVLGGWRPGLVARVIRTLRRAFGGRRLPSP